MFTPNSRYARQPTDQRTLANGRIVTLVRPPLPGVAAVKGWYRRQNGQRLDMIAASFLADATGAWRLCDANDAVVPDALASRDLVGIPTDAPGGR